MDKTIHEQEQQALRDWANKTITGAQFDARMEEIGAQGDCAVCYSDEFLARQAPCPDCRELCAAAGHVCGESQLEQDPWEDRWTA